MYVYYKINYGGKFYFSTKKFSLNVGFTVNANFKI